MTPKTATLCEIMRNDGHWTVQGRSRSHNDDHWTVKGRSRSHNDDHWTVKGRSTSTILTTDHKCTCDFNSHRSTVIMAYWSNYHF